jgi:hypothetical protein
LGQLTHSIPAGASSLLIRVNSFASSALDFVKNIAKSSGAFSPRTLSHPASAAFNSALTLDGASTSQTCAPGFIPSFFGSGVPEYPGMEVKMERAADCTLWVEKIQLEY